MSPSHLKGGLNFLSLKRTSMQIKKYFCLWVIINLLFLIFPGHLKAIDSSVGFDQKTGYDIYFYNGYGSSSVIRGIKIMGFQEIGGKTFVIIRPYGFKLDETYGYVLLDSVTAILPNLEFRIETNQNVNIKY